MVAVVRGPPEHALLRGGGGHDGDDELKRAAGLKGAMGKVAMVPGGDEEHPHVKQRQADNQVRPAKTQKKHRHTCQVNGKKRKRADQGDPCAIAEGNRCGCHTEVSFGCAPGMPTAVSASVEEEPAAAAADMFRFGMTSRERRLRSSSTCLFPVVFPIQFGNAHAGLMFDPGAAAQ